MMIFHDNGRSSLFFCERLLLHTIKEVGLMYEFTFYKFFITFMEFGTFTEQIFHLNVQIRSHNALVEQRVLQSFSEVIELSGGQVIEPSIHVAVG